MFVAWAKMAERRVQDDLEPYRQKMRAVVGMYFRFPSGELNRYSVQIKNVERKRI